MNPTDDSYDLIIVGGGPAGATATLYAARRGLKVLLLDKARFPRDKICGDALSGKSIAILHDLDLLERVRQLPGALVRAVTFGNPDGAEARIELSRHDHRDLLTGKVLPMEGFVIRRQVFDEFLFGEARPRAHRCLEGFAVRELLIEGGRVCGVRGQAAGGEEREFRGRLVLGCDGFNSVVARKAGCYEHDPRHWVVALRCYCENVADLRDQIELHFVDEVLPGYFWIFPLEKGCANVGIGMLHEGLKERKVDLRQALRQVIARPPFARRFAQARPLEEPVGWNLPVASKRRRIHGEGFLLLGDAASLIDPFTGEGIGNALYSARLAVETAAQALEAGDCSAAFLQRYEEGLWEALGDELRISTRLQQLGRYRPLLNMVIRKAARDPQLSDLICGMIANALPKKALTSPLFYLKLLFR
ncbi:MAG: geranylgeranyl reductase family protein [Candidatus Latescibacteria bacterium]|nr:geranylgeranyl reductase family protein [Candidatus Latescibacterota bacterium]